MLSIQPLLRRHQPSSEMEGRSCSAMEGPGLGVFGVGDVVVVDVGEFVSGEKKTWIRDKKGKKTKTSRTSGR